MIESIKLKKWQIRVFSACFIAYTAAYICRVNISIGLPAIKDAFGYSSAGVGLIGTAFFWAYAAGQLVNGYIGDRVSGRVFVFVGLLMSVLLNILFGFSSALVVMIILWGANGIFQSMLWGPLVKTLSNWFPVKKSTLISFGMSITMIIGYLIAWGFSGAVLERFGWKWVFWLPAGIVLVLAGVWYAIARNKPSDAGLPGIQEEAGNKEISTAEMPAGEAAKEQSLWKLIKGTNLLFIAITGAAQGIIKDSITLWSPKLLMDTQGISLSSTIGIILIIPVVNFIGILFAGSLNKLFKSKEKITIMVLMIGSFFASLGLMLFIHVNIVLSIILIACTSAFMFGANPMMTTIIPLNYKKYNKVSMVAGFIDFSIYVGSGLAGVFTGLVVDKFGWNSVFALWCLISALGVLSMGVVAIKERKLGKWSGKGYNDISGKEGKKV
jgi:sugar phosphate permease